MMGTICTYCELGVESDDVDGSGVCGRCRMRADAAALFVVNDSPVFIGYDTGATWNGWAVPEFEHVEILAILGWLESCGQITRLHGEGWTNPVNGNVHYFDTATNEFHKLVPDESGRYTFDGWCWDLVRVDFDAWGRETLESFEYRLGSVPFTDWNDFAEWRVSVLHGFQQYGDTDAMPNVARWLGRN